MLVLTVREEGRVYLTDDRGRVSTVILIRSMDGKAKLGFEAPDSVSILRGEVAPRQHHDEQPAR